MPFTNVRGTDAFRETVIQSTKSHRHYFIGTDDLTLNALRENLLSINSDFNLVGTCTASFLEIYNENYATVLQDLRIQQPSIVWVGLGSPKQDYLAGFISREFPAAVVAVGAAFDFIAGRKAEAPKVMQKFGLEWLFRFGSEPRRLWKRYLIGILQFIALCVKELSQILWARIRS
jgi:N-acetylglucosaminyldiphosphoundecaprenol N-acetyl-beta-D-mannosaminyltransferase